MKEAVVEGYEAAPAWRIIAGFIIAPFVVAFALAWAMPLYEGLPSLPDRIIRTLPWYLIVGGYVPAILFGLPLYFVLRKRLAPTLINCALAGAAVASIPSLLLGLLIRDVDYEYGGGHVVVLHGHKTLWGWVFLAKNIGEMALIGLAAGATFWLVVAADIPRKPTT